MLKVKRKTAEENAEIRRKIMFDEFEYVTCNLKDSYQVRPDYPFGQIREFEAESAFVVRESDRPAKDMFIGAGDGTPVQVGTYFYKFYSSNMWRKIMEQEDELPGVVFGGRMHEIIHDPNKYMLDKLKEEETKKKPGRPKKTEE